MIVKDISQKNKLTNDILDDIDIKYSRNQQEVLGENWTLPFFLNKKKSSILPPFAKLIREISLF